MILSTLNWIITSNSYLTFLALAAFFFSLIFKLLKGK